MTPVVDSAVIKELGCLPYDRALQDMRAFTARRTASTPDEFWILEHPPVYTLGQGASEVAPGNAIPVVRSDRGGEVTYHGPGQVVLYTLVDLARAGIKVKQYVWMLEQSVIDLLRDLLRDRLRDLPAEAGVRVERRPGAPGVYVDGAKIAALGIRVTRGRAYHGLALNVDMDLAPFNAIDPCGYPGLAVTQTKDLGLAQDALTLGRRVAESLISRIENA